MSQLVQQEKEVLVKVSGVSKKFCRSLKRSLYYGIGDVLGEVVGQKGNHDHLRKDEFWAVKDISFELKRGECLGLIGHNGAGKSTLLKMLNGLIKPDQGMIEITGKVGALIELGAGFNPVLTGRENIYNNAAILGFTKEDVDEKFDEIVAFSEIGEFIDMPVQNYSSGMKVRLGFSVAAQLEPDVLIIDEVLAVGDIGFVIKCLNNIDKLIPNTCVIFVAHNMPMVARICTQIMLMKNGKVLVHSADVAEGIAEYFNQFDFNVVNYIGNEDADLKSVKIYSNGIEISPKESAIHHQHMTIQIDIIFKRKLNQPRLYLAIYDKEQRNFAEIFNFLDVIKIDEAIGHYSFQATLPNLPLNQGIYSLTISLSSIVDNGVRQTVFRHQNAHYFNVKSKKVGWAPVQLVPDWTYEKVDTI